MPDNPYRDDNAARIIFLEQQLETFQNVTREIHIECMTLKDKLLKLQSQSLPKRIGKWVKCNWKTIVGDPIWVGLFVGSILAIVLAVKDSNSADIVHRWAEPVLDQDKITLSCKAACAKEFPEDIVQGWAEEINEHKRYIRCDCLRAAYTFPWRANTALTKDHYWLKK